MTPWNLFITVLTFPGRVLIRFLPGLDAQHKRLLAHMANYLFWLTPSIGFATWYAIQRAMSLAQH